MNGGDMKLLGPMKERERRFKIVLLWACEQENPTFADLRWIGHVLLIELLGTYHNKWHMINTHFKAYLAYFYML